MNFNFYIPQKLKGISPIIWEMNADSPTNWQMLPESLLSLTFKLKGPWKIHSGIFTEKSYNPTEKLSFICGLQTKPFKISFSNLQIMGVGLSPIAAKLLFGVPCSELLNYAVSTEDIFPQQIEMIENEIQKLPDFISRAIWIEDFVLKHLQDHPDYGLAIKVSNVLDQITHNKIQGNPVDIYSLSGYSRMHTYRIFKDWMGLSPSKSIVIRQFNHTLENMHNNQETMTQIALANGYYDQPHLIRTFKQFAEMTPREYLKNKTEVVGQLPF